MVAPHRRRPVAPPAATVAALWLPAVALAVDVPAAGERPVDFAREVRPILAWRCFACLGPDASHREADLGLDAKDGAFADLGGHRAFAPGAPDESEALRRIGSDDPLDRMPPGGLEKRVPPEQAETLRRLVAQGAAWRLHWSIETPTRPPLPPVRDAAWSRNGLDRFVLACLDAEGLVPATEELERFLADRATEAYERMVERPLASPYYGEHWAWVWLDLACFADTKGYEKDLARNIWRYRDGVIDAFNADLPHDRFALEQEAGDLLPDSGPAWLLATAFHGNTLTNDEGGTDDEEFRVAAVEDRVDTTGQVWLGLTVGCAKCHSHNSDPIAQREYYQLFAFFDQTADHDRYDDSPAGPSATPEQSAEIDRLWGQVRADEAEPYAPTPARLEASRAWESAQNTWTRWSTPAPPAMVASSRSRMTRLEDGSILVEGLGPAVESYTLRIPAHRGG